jgi:hypothetical protein
METLSLHWQGYKAIAGLAAMLAMLTGCALTPQQKDAVGGFGAAANILGDVTTSELDAIRDDTVRMNTERLLLTGRSPQLPDQETLDTGFTLGTVETISGATRALAAYGKMLAGLANDTQSADIQAASQEFAANVGSLPGVKAQLGDDKLNVIGSAVNSLGSTFVDWKRKQAVTAIVNNAGPAVDALCDLMIRDFSASQPRGFVALHLTAIESPLMDAATIAFNKAQTYDDRKVALDAFRLGHGNRLRLTEVLERITSAAKAMKKANRALALAVNDSSLSIAEIQEFVQKSRTLQAAVKAVAANHNGENHG